MAGLPGDPARCGRASVTAARIVLWRHGRTEWNRPTGSKARRTSARSVGMEQAAAAAPLLAMFAPVALYSSDLSRAYRTATALADITGLEIETDKRLREIDVGSWEGLTVPRCAPEPRPRRAVAAGGGRLPFADR